MSGISESLAGAVSPEAMPMVVAALVMIGTLGILWVLSSALLADRMALRRRLELTGSLEPRTAGAGSVVSEHRRKQSIEKALSEMARRERSKQRAKLTLAMRLSQADLPWTVTSFYLRAVGAGVFATKLARPERWSAASRSARSRVSSASTSTSRRSGRGGRGSSWKNSRTPSTSSRAASRLVCRSATASRPSPPRGRSP